MTKCEGFCKCKTPWACSVSEDKRQRVAKALHAEDHIFGLWAKADKTQYFRKADAAIAAMEAPEPVPSLRDALVGIVDPVIKDAHSGNLPNPWELADAILELVERRLREGAATLGLSFYGPLGSISDFITAADVVDAVLAPLREGK